MGQSYISLDKYLDSFMLINVCKMFSEFIKVFPLSLHITAFPNSYKKCIAVNVNMRSFNLSAWKYY